jgi:hypothetical protein
MKNQDLTDVESASKGSEMSTLREYINNRCISIHQDKYAHTAAKVFTTNIHYQDT